MRDAFIRVSGVEVAARQAKTRAQIFAVLWQRFLEDLRDGRSPAEFRTVNVDALAAQLKKDPEVIRRTVNRFQEDIEVEVKRKSGEAISREDIIETVRRAGQLDADFGYRINPRTVVTRPAEDVGPECAATSRAASASRERT